ncbi:MAG: AAA family ATPase [Methylosarcina sp.]
MTTQAIQNLEITNFKCFKDLKVSGIGRVNLIGGKNNVGKTAFLEAVELLVLSNEAYDLANLLYSNVLKRRQKDTNAQQIIELDCFYNIDSDIILSSNAKKCTLERWINVPDDSSPSNEEDSPFPTEILSATVNGDAREIPIDSLTSSYSYPSFKRTKKYPKIYIPSSKVSERDIAISLGAVTMKNREAFLNDSLSLFDSGILEIKPIATESGITLRLKLKNKDSLVLLSSLGEGINRYVAILCSIWANKDGFLLIDEIENGIHYTNYKKLWEIIFEASVAANCQLFVTTHSKECIEAFNEVQFENESCDAQYFEFYKNLKTGLIDASGIDKEQLRYSLTHEGRVRGE